jgi:hypothetical protein
MDRLLFASENLLDIGSRRTLELVSGNSVSDQLVASITRSGVGRGNRRRGKSDKGACLDSLPRASRFPKTCHRMAAKGIQFLWWWESSTISMNLDGIWGMLVDWP